MNGVAPEAEEVGQLKEVRSHVTFALFRFNRRKLWAFAAMGLRRSGLQDVPGLRFARMMGSGSGIGFSARPDFSRYALFAVWRNRASADAFFAESPFVEAYRKRASALRTWHLAPTRVQGAWDGEVPLVIGEKVETENGQDDQLQGGDDQRGDVRQAVLTRATIRPRHLLRFWQSVAPVADELAVAPGRIFSIGVGEAPWIRQATFSVWESAQAMQDFAYRSEEHRAVIRRTREEGWYSEEMFARFALLGIDDDGQRDENDFEENHDETTRP